MRRSVASLLKQPKPPEVVLIKRDHAEHLGLEFFYVHSVNEVSSIGIERGLMYGSVVRVKLHDLYMKLQTAIGIDADDYESSKRERASVDSGR